MKNSNVVWGWYSILKRRYIENNEKVYHVLILLICLALSFRTIPWAADDISYLDYVAYSGGLLLHVLLHPLTLFVNEPLWLLVNTVLGFFADNEFGVRTIIFTSTFIALHALKSLSNRSLLMLLAFVLIGEILAKYILHIRQGLAISLFLWGLVRGGRAGLVLRLLTPFIHTSFWIVIFYELYEWFFRRIKWQYKYRLSLFAILNMIIIFLIPILAEFLNDRRADFYNFTMAPDASGKGFIFWLILGSLFVYFVKKNTIGMLGSYGVIFYLESYFFLEFSPRILENFLPLVVLGMIKTEGKVKAIFIVGLMIYSILGWYFRGGFVF